MELIPGGSQISVTKKNREEYVMKYVDYIFNTSIKMQFDAFKVGFLRVLGNQQILVSVGVITRL